MSQHPEDRLEQNLELYQEARRQCIRSGVLGGLYAGVGTTGAILLASRFCKKYTLLILAPAIKSLTPQIKLATISSKNFYI